MVIYGRNFGYMVNFDGELGVKLIEINAHICVWPFRHPNSFREGWQTIIGQYSIPTTFQVHV